jgi:formiminoglutamate deiminase
LWCELGWLGGERVERGVLIEVDEGRIAALSTGVAAPAAGCERLEGLAIPGLANAHSHAFQRALRGRTQGDPSGRRSPSTTDAGSFWTWRKQMYALAESITPEAMHELSRATFGEMALAGITLVGEFHYLHHRPGGARYDEPNAMGNAIVQAAREAGVRLTLLDTCYLHGGIGSPADGSQLRFCDADADDWRRRVERLADALRNLADHERLRVGAAIHSVRAVDPDSAETVAAWAADRDAPLHAHVSELPAENEACMQAYGASPTELLERTGALSPRFTAVHATHVSARDIALLGAARASCCLCPTTERDLADGVGPARALRDGGARLALGTDSNAVIEPFEEARAVELDERLVTGVRGSHGAPALLHAATRGGYESLGWPEGGHLREGGLADLVAIRLGGVRLAGASPDQALEALVFAGAAADVSDVLVGGTFVVRDGAHVALDVPRQLEAAIASLAW